MIVGGYPIGGAPIGAGPGFMTAVPSMTMAGAATMAVRLYDRRVAILEDMRTTAVHAVTLKAWDIAAEVEVTLRFTDHEFVTQADDTPANTAFLGDLKQPIEFSRSMLRSTGFGGLVRGSGTIVLQNADGAYDTFEDAYAIDGRAVEVRVGRAGDYFEDMLPIFAGTVFDHEVASDGFRIMVRDKAATLDVPVVNSPFRNGPVAFAGTGGLEGGEDLFFKRKPVVFGEATNFAPPLVWPQKNIYMANCRPFTLIPALPYIYVNGVRITISAVYTSVTDPGFATFTGSGAPASGQAWLAADLGLSDGAIYIRLGAVPNNQVVTMSLKVLRGIGSLSGFPATSKAAAISDMAWFATPMSWPDDFDVAAFTQHNTAQPYGIGLWFDQNDTTTLADAIDMACGETTFAGFDGEGKFTIGVVSTSNVSPVVSLDETNILEIARERLPDGLSPVPWRWQLGWLKSHTDMQGRMAGSLSELERAFFSERVRIAGYQNGPLKTVHPTAQDRVSLDDMLVSYLDAIVEAQRLYSLFASGRRLYRIVTTRIGLMARFGTRIRVTCDRYGLADGKSMTVISDRYDAQTGRVELLGFG
jgi:hypothetical protein